MTRAGKVAHRRSSTGHNSGPSTRRSNQRVSSLGIEVCDVCHVCFYSKSSLAVHKRVHQRGRSYECTDCDKVYDNQVSLRDHAKSHLATAKKIPAKKLIIKKKTIKTTGKLIPKPAKMPSETKEPDATFACPICQKVFTNLHASISHRKVHKNDHKKSVQTKMVGTSLLCMLCKRVFYSEASWMKHMKSSHRPGDKTDEIQGSNCSYECVICSQTFTDVNSLDKHSLEHKNVTTTKRRSLCRDSERDSTAVNKEIEQSPKFTCTACERKFFSLNGLATHKRVHGQMFVKLKKAKKPERIKEAKVNDKPTTEEILEECDVCRKSFNSKVSLQMHKINHFKRDLSNQKRLPTRKRMLPLPPKKRLLMDQRRVDECDNSIVVIEKLDPKLHACLDTESENEVSSESNLVSEMPESVNVEMLGEAGEEISMTVDEDCKISIVKEFAKDCGEIIQSPNHPVSEIEIVSLDDSLNTVEVEVVDSNSENFNTTESCVDKPKEDSSPENNKDDLQNTKDKKPLCEVVKDKEQLKLVHPVVESSTNSSAQAINKIKKQAHKIESTCNNRTVKNVTKTVGGKTKEGSGFSNGGSGTSPTEGSEPKISKGDVPLSNDIESESVKDSENPELKGIIAFINNQLE